MLFIHGFTKANEPKCYPQLDFFLSIFIIRIIVGDFAPASGFAVTSLFPTKQK